ncbi:hypothetical protein HKD37_02G003920 [Glycine soja]
MTILHVNMRYDAAAKDDLPINSFSNLTFNSCLSIDSALVLIYAFDYIEHYCESVFRDRVNSASHLWLHVYLMKRGFDYVVLVAKPSFIAARTKSLFLGTRRTCPNS